MPKKSKDQPQDDLQTRKDTLVAKAKKDGHISQRDIFEVIPEEPANTEILDALYTELANRPVVGLCFS